MLLTRDFESQFCRDFKHRMLNKICFQWHCKSEEFVFAKEWARGGCHRFGSFHMCSNNLVFLKSKLLSLSIINRTFFTWHFSLSIKDAQSSKVTTTKECNDLAATLYMSTQKRHMQFFHLRSCQGNPGNKFVTTTKPNGMHFTSLRHFAYHLISWAHPKLTMSKENWYLKYKFTS